MSISIINVLFQYILYNNTISFEQIDLSEIPLYVFGIFVTIKRSDKQKLSYWPYNIHGCIGYWDKNFNILDNKTIVNKILKVGKSAFYDDSRKKYFNLPVEEDEGCLFEITFMLKPLYVVENGEILINSKNKIKFNNTFYGIIVQDTETDKCATYLPKVFENESWDFIKSNIKEKAGVSNSYNLVFFAYKTKVIDKNIDMFLKKNGGNIIDFEIIKTNFGIFLNKYYVEFVPYEIISNKIIIDRKQYVRNIATIYDIKRFIKNINTNVKQLIKKNLNYYIKLYLDNTQELRQSSGFLALTLQLIQNEEKINDYDEIIKLIIKNLYKDTIDKKLEYKFELGEVLMTLSIIDPKPLIINKQIDFLLSIIKFENIIDSIFQLNWISKFIQSYNSTKPIELGLFDLIYNHLIVIIPKINAINETNYLAVGYESITCLYIYALEHGLDFNNDFFTSNISRIYKILSERYNENYFMFEFTNKTMRLDITGHILNGIKYFEQIKLFDYKSRYYKYKNKYISLKQNIFH
jgi:hypothetical protein